MKPVIRDTKRKVYCGPMSIAAVTGERASRVLAAIDAYRASRGEDLTPTGKRRTIRGMYPWEVRGALHALGYSADIVTYRKKDQVTLAAWLRDHKPSGPVIVFIRGHYLAFDGRHCIDTATKGKPVPHSKAPNRRARVQAFYVIAPRPFAIQGRTA